ncbi:hypothetical protein CRE_21047 [Caenorhabditis remanei]|uniref:Protein kinase domain-containing protein n=1 Tax=Caenorhabditis remanei TaxID=31234 RepID=E3NNZ0_CAERE|nr:hypothetical protein CRE_21047 [Caenorhabditis remanei]
MCHLDVIGVFHLDLKPENIYFVDDGKFELTPLPSRHLSIVLRDTRIQIGDFGCSKFHPEDGAEPTPKLVQTQNYRSPEVFIGLPYSIKSDVWSFGAVMSEMYTGELLFYGSEDEHSAATQFQMMQDIVGQYMTREMWKEAKRLGSKIPIFSLKIPIFSSKIPIFSLKIPIFSSKIPIFSLKIPIFSLKIPIFSSKIPIFSSTTVQKSRCLFKKGAKYETELELHQLARKDDMDGRDLYEFITDVLILDPEYRPTFAQLKNHEFFQKIFDF